MTRTESDRSITPAPAGDRAAPERNGGRGAPDATGAPNEGAAEEAIARATAALGADEGEETGR